MQRVLLAVFFYRLSARFGAGPVRSSTAPPAAPTVLRPAALLSSSCTRAHPGPIATRSSGRGRLKKYGWVRASAAPSLPSGFSESSACTPQLTHLSRWWAGGWRRTGAGSELLRKVLQRVWGAHRAERPRLCRRGRPRQDLLPRQRRPARERDLPVVRQALHCRPRLLAWRAEHGDDAAELVNVMLAAAQRQGVRDAARRERSIVSGRAHPTKSGAWLRSSPRTQPTAHMSQPPS